MRSDLKIGIIVGGLLLVGLVVYFMSRGGEPTETENIPVGDNIPNPVGGTPPALVGEEIDQDQPPVQDPEQGGAPPEEQVTPPEQVQATPPGEVTPPEQQVNTPPPAQQVPPPDDLNDERQPRFYTVKEGDSLSGISMSYYAHEKFALVIQKVNADKITDVNQLRTGWRLRIPYPDEAAKIWSER